MSIGEAVARQTEQREERKRVWPSNGVLISELLGPDDGPHEVPSHFWNPAVWQPPR